VLDIRMLTYAGVCWRMLTYAGEKEERDRSLWCWTYVCWRMLAYADLCWRMLAYADVFRREGGARQELVVLDRRMLTYADVC
jgi:hypothetical protein